MDKLDLKNSHLHIAAQDPQELKEWKVGKKYTVKIVAKMQSMQHDETGGHAHLNLIKVIPDNKEENYSNEAIKSAVKEKVRP